MFKLVTFSAFLVITCASPDGGFGGAAKFAVKGAVKVAKLASLFGVGGPSVAAAIKGAELFFGESDDAISGLHKKGKIEYSSVLQYYTDLGIEFFPDTGCCTCPTTRVFKPNSPNYSPISPFFINGVHPIHETEFCTCPPELIASVVQASHHKPGLLGRIAKYVKVIPRLAGKVVKSIG
ncbi:uncharacterized protein [Leptinotarsa decemlineata]|uniref:uncharacterized protein n=1 Tax=Leptinotarsa decemlineata TaxID=7539 RepID=UPI003D30A4AD